MIVLAWYGSTPLTLSYTASWECSGTVVLVLLGTAELKLSCTLFLALCSEHCDNTLLGFYDIVGLGHFYTLVLTLAWELFDTFVLEHRHIFLLECSGILVLEHFDTAVLESSDIVVVEDFYRLEQEGIRSLWKLHNLVGQLRKLF